MSKKVLILTNNDGGLYLFRNEVIERLLQEHEVVLGLPNGKYRKHFVDMGCEYIPIAFNRHNTNPFKDLRLLNTYKKLIRQIKPDVVLTYTIKPNVYGGLACRITKTPQIANITGLGTAVENGGLMQKITVFLYKIGLKKAKTVFFQNTENQSFMLKHGIVKNNCDLLPGSGVNLQHFFPIEYPSGKRLEFVFIGRIMKEKGINQYFEAAQYIKKKYPDTVFHVCGTCEEDYTEKLKKLSDDGYIIYHGSVSDIRVILKDVSCTIHPTYYPEGLSNVLLESSACARPIITTDRPGCREVIENGKNGYIVRQKDSKDLIEKIEKFITLPWEEKRQMGLYGRAKVEREFDRDIVIEKYMKEIKDVDSSREQMQ